MLTSVFLDTLDSDTTRSVLVTLSFLIDIGLAVLLRRVILRQRAKENAMRALLTDHKETQRTLQYQYEIQERQSVLLAELAGHIEIALGRNRFSTNTAELLQDIKDRKD